MNYRHVYHAGNFADVFKHIVLMLCLDHLRKKDKPFFVLDTHAGIGLYDLNAQEAQKTGESAEGIGRLWPENDLPQIAAGYMAMVRSFNDDGVLRFYPGSPLFSRSMLRPGDRLVANELHPEDSQILKKNLGPFRNVHVETMDGYQALKAFLPPPEKRGLVLIDPPFEEADEFERITGGLREAHKRWAIGIYALWYPIKDPARIAAWHRDLADLGIPDIAAFDFYRQPPEDVAKLNGCGMVLVNGPWTLAQDLIPVKDCLITRLTGGQGEFKITRIAQES